MINKQLRYQKDFKMQDMFPKLPGICACGCGRKLPGRRTKWYSDPCIRLSYIQYAVIKGDNHIIRQEVFNRDAGMCADCGVQDDNWQADHIVPVSKGGGGCRLDNFQTLCVVCHKKKTKIS